MELLFSSLWKHSSSCGSWPKRRSQNLRMWVSGFCSACSVADFFFFKVGHYTTYIWTCGSSYQKHYNCWSCFDSGEVEPAEIASHAPKYRSKFHRILLDDRLIQFSHNLKCERLGFTKSWRRAPFVASLRDLILRQSHVWSKLFKWLCTDNSATTKSQTTILGQQWCYARFGGR